ncbi:hypothetical protein VNO78_35159 [Psophocarpus tetragonolobus]|uniref:Uncharacterized protein n=1 Tax=Psophocarpus tetragonolobus TaxID=3891 RepID=A0AAN9RKC3_PSOTE
MLDSTGNDGSTTPNHKLFLTVLYYTVTHKTRPRLPCSSSSRVKGVAKFVGEVFLDLYDLSEGATRYEWLLKEEAQSKGRLLSSQDTDYRDPKFEIDVAEICLKQPMVCNPLRPRDVEAPPSKPRSSVPFTTSRRSTASESGKADSIVASQPAYSRTSSRGISYDLTKMRFDLGEYLLPQTKAEEGYVLVANTVQRGSAAVGSTTFAARGFGTRPYAAGGGKGHPLNVLLPISIRVELARLCFADSAGERVSLGFVISSLNLISVSLLARSYCLSRSEPRESYHNGLVLLSVRGVWG